LCFSPSTSASAVQPNPSRSTVPITRRVIRK
jgi:hypothetical protein